MGIYDREYYRGETRGSGWLTGIAPACKTIIIINVVVFFIQPNIDPEILRNYLQATSEGIFYHGRVWELLTATFLHADMMHLLWNMVFLWFVGREMESFYGTRDFVALYITGAIVSTLGWATVDFFSRNHVVEHSMLGSSGAVWTVVVLYALYYPHREMLLFFILPVETWLLVVILLGMDLWQLLNGHSVGGTAVAAHLSGAAYGYLFKRFDLRWSRLSWARVRGPRLRVISPEPREKSAPPPRPSGPTWSPNTATAPKPSTTAVVPEEQLDAKLDEVLAKIAREGRSGLSEEENRVLQEASRRARNRRSDRI